MIAVLGGILLWPASWLKAKAKKLAFGIEKIEKLKTVNGWAILKIKDREILFIRDDEESVRALNPICTHKQCTVEYNPELKKIVCPCHGSTYDLEGKVLKGPAQKSLGVYETEYSEGRVILTIEDE